MLDFLAVQQANGKIAASLQNQRFAPEVEAKAFGGAMGEQTMSDNLKLMCVSAHPGDESPYNGSMLAKYASQGVETHVVLATRGEKAQWTTHWDYHGPEAFGRVRESELRSAATLLGVRHVTFLGYRTGVSRR